HVDTTISGVVMLASPRGLLLARLHLGLHLFQLALVAPRTTLQRRQLAMERLDLARLQPILLLERDGVLVQPAQLLLDHVPGLPRRRCPTRHLTRGAVAMSRQRQPDPVLERPDLVR